MHAAILKPTEEIVRRHKSKFQGVHIMPLGWSDTVADILVQADSGRGRHARHTELTGCLPYCKAAMILLKIGID